MFRIDVTKRHSIYTRRLSQYAHQHDHTRQTRARVHALPPGTARGGQGRTADDIERRTPMALDDADDVGSREAHVAVALERQERLAQLAGAHLHARVGGDSLWISATGSVCLLM